MSHYTIINLRKFDDLNDELDFLFNNYFKHQHPVMIPVDKGWKPLTDIYETANEVVVVRDIAGIAVNDISVNIKGRILILRVICREQNLDPKRKYHKLEVDFGPFERIIELPCPVDTEYIMTRYNRGFLEVRLPKGNIYSRKKIEIPIR